MLGDLDVRVGGRRALLPASKKTRALLGYLVLTGAAHLRSHLCDLLWQGPDDPRAALRWSLTKLRSVIGQDHVAADRERVSFVGAKCDATDVRVVLERGPRAVSTDALRSVAAAFRGELLEGLELPDCYRYHEWCIGEREALRRLRVEVLRELVERSEGDPAAALAHARAWLAVDPVAEAPHVALVRLLTALGRNVEASEQVEACRRILSSELGVEPSAALAAARTRSPDARPPSPSPPAPPAAGSVQEPNLPFVGRRGELATLDAAWRAVRGSGARVVLVTGEPGIGKTRLVAEVAASVSAASGRVLRGRAFEAEMVRPYGPWVDALRGAGVDATFLSPRGSAEAELGRPDAATFDRARVFDVAAEALRRLSEAGGCFVAFDDLQWFDEASLALLHFVARALHDAPVIVACTARGDELLESAIASRCVRAMQRDGRLEAIALGPLDDASTSALARAVDAGVDAARVVGDSGGHPFYAIELARAQCRGLHTSDSLDALLADRLDRIDPRSREILPWAAALGRSFRADVLARAIGAPDGDLLAALAELERRGVLRADASALEPVYDFGHDLLRVAAYRRLSSPRRVFVHRAIARALVPLAAADESLHGDVAHQAALGADHALAASAAVAAAKRCVRMFANDEAARLAESGLAHAERLPAEERLRVRLALLSVKVLSGRWLGRAAELGGALTGAVEEARGRGMHVEAMRGLYHLAILQREHGDLAGAHESMRHAIDLSLHGDAAARGRQLVHGARCLGLIDRDMDQARAMIEEASDLLADHERDFDWCWARALERDYCDAAEAGELLERAHALGRDSQDRFGECECLIRLVQRELERGSPARALAWCRELRPVAAKMTDGSDGAIADALEALGRVACCIPAADAHLEGAIDRLRHVDAKGMLAYVLASAAEIDRGAGRPERARLRATAALEAAELVNRRSLVARARASLAEIALDEADPDAARGHLAAVAQDMQLPLGISARARVRVERASSRLRGGAAAGVTS